ncbi:MAG: flagellar FliJ family protein [Campylobacteraceae bacterium]|nr:flagellar FliJ family protein [Campylobacteraceae bacterium]
MKSKFSKIAKVRKQKRDAIEKELLKNQNKERMISHKITSIYEEIVNVKMPQNGTISLFSLVGEQKRILNRDKKRYEQELEIAQSVTKKLQLDYKKVHIDYEKINYLEEQELQEFINKMKRQEQLDLDEISTMLFANDTNKKGQ